MTVVDDPSRASPAGLDDESRRMVLDMVGQLRERLLTRERILEYDRDEIFPEALIRSLLGPDVGLQLLFIPEDYGGMGGGARDCCAVTREMSKICLGIATAVFAVQLGADPLLVGGTPEQKEKWLGKIAAGEAVCAYAVTEPGAGSNVAAVAAKAEPVTDDAGVVTGYRINGAKQFISNGAAADFVTLLARAPEGLSFFVVEKGAAGFSAGKPEEKHGIRASNTSSLTLDDVYVPVDNLIGGEAGKGMKQASQVFGYTRLMVAAMAIGAGEAALDIAVNYAKERIQFGGPLTEKQGYVHKLIVPNAVRLEAAAAYLETIALRLDSGEEDLQTEGAVAKLFASEAADKTAADAMQALGGYGYIREFEVEKIKRDVKITCIYEGTSEIQQNIISMFRWKKTRKSKGAFYQETANRAAELASTIPDAGCDTLADAAGVLNEIVMLADQRRLTKSQTVMFALADMMTYVEVGIALAEKAARSRLESKPEANRLRSASRIFAAEVAGVVAENAARIVYGTNVIPLDEGTAFLSKTAAGRLHAGARGVITEMDVYADTLFS